MGGFVKVANVDDVTPGEGRVIDINGTEIALFNVGGNFYAIDNCCPHKGGPLGMGALDGEVVTCPWHGFQYDVKSGKSPIIPNSEVDSFEVRVDGSDVLVAMG